MTSKQNPPLRKKRKHGGQPGNKNALKHGIYSQRFTPDEARILEEMEIRLEGEIGLLRLHINGLAAKLEGTDYGETAIDQLYCMSDLIIKVTTVTRTLAWITGRITPTARNAVAAIFMNREVWAKVLK